MTNAKVITKDEDTVVLEIEDGYSAVLIELPGDFTPESFFKSTEEVDISKPLPGEHACSHAASSKFDKFRSDSRDSGGKRYRVIYGRVVGTNRWEVNSFRYPVGVWDVSAARKHCKDHQGIAFEPAIAKTENPEEMIEGGYVIKKTDELRHLVYGLALEPGVVDLQKDIETEDEIEKAAHSYMVRLWRTEEPDMVGAEHSYPIEAAVVVESYIAPLNFWFDGTPQDDEHLVRKGSWVLVSLIKDDEEFQRVLSGEYTGYSIQGSGKRKPVV